MRNLKPIIAATCAYLLVTFPWAIVWHLVLLKETYEEIGYIGRQEPLFLFGFLSILIQGGVMSVAFPFVARESFTIRNGLRYALWIGLFFWTSHVLAFAAKGDIARLDLFFPLETFYLLIQFGAFGLILGWVFQKWGVKPDEIHQPQTKKQTV